MDAEHKVREVFLNGFVKHYKGEHRAARGFQRQLSFVTYALVAEPDEVAVRIFSFVYRQQR
jgi:hypothetical protein